METSEVGEKPQVSFVDSIAAMVVNRKNNASLTALVNRAVGEFSKENTPPQEYLRVTDLVNPVGAYWSRNVALPDPPDLARRFAYGKRMHRQAGYWFSSVPDFLLAEGRLEGGYVGVEGVVGDIDFLLGKSVLEFKTKAVPPEEPADVTSYFPQDVEQTLFYGILLPDASDEHLLVFLDDRDLSFRGFRIRIKNKGTILNLLRQRVRLIRDALQQSDPSSLGKCRYFDAGCKFRQAGVCGCEKLRPLESSPLRTGLEITRDRILEDSLRVAREAASTESELIRVWDLMSPRRRLLRHLGHAPSYTPNTIKLATGFILQESIRKTQELKVDEAVSRKCKDDARGFGLHLVPRLLRARSARDKAMDIAVPYIARVSYGRILAPHEVYAVYLAELAVSCAITQSAKGVVFVAYPDADNNVVAYDVSFRSARDLRAYVGTQVERIKTAEATKDLSLLDRCPSYMRKECGEGCLCVEREG